MIKQNMVFVENKAGSLQKVTRLLAQENVDIYGFACFDAPEFALFRMVSNMAEKVARILTENGYVNRVTDVIAVDLDEQVGGLDEVLDVIGESNVSLNYIYTSYHRNSQIPVVILNSEELFMIEHILKSRGFTVLDDAKQLQE